MVESKSSTRGRHLILAALGALVILAAAYIFWVYSESDTGRIVPFAAEIHPEDGSVIYGTHTLVRWEWPEETNGRVLWRREGESDFRESPAGNQTVRIARLEPLEPDVRYEYIVEEDGAGFTLHSDLRSFRVAEGLHFDPAVVEASIDRDYDQTVKLSLRNDSAEAVTVAARALTRFADLPADVVGPGSVDKPLELAQGATHTLRLAVFAPDAEKELYEIPIEASGAVGLARVRVSRPEIKLSFEVIDENPVTLSKTIEIRNEGDTVGDLALRVAPPQDREVRLEPSATHALLPGGENLRFVANPVLFLEFESLAAEIEATAAGQNFQFPVEFRVAEGRKLTGVRTGTGYPCKSFDWYCTNKPISCSDLPCLGGSGASPVVFPSDIMSERAPLCNPSGSSLRAVLRRDPPDRLARSGLTSLRSSTFTAFAAPPPTAQPSEKASESDSGSGELSPEDEFLLPRPGECDPKTRKCLEDCVKKARQYQEEFRQAVLREREIRRLEEKSRRGGLEYNLLQIQLEILNEKREVLRSNWDKLRRSCKKRCNFDIGYASQLAATVPRLRFPDEDEEFQDEEAESQAPDSPSDSKPGGKIQKGKDLSSRAAKAKTRVQSLAAMQSFASVSGNTLASYLALSDTYDRLEGSYEAGNRIEDSPPSSDFLEDVLPSVELVSTPPDSKTDGFPHKALTAFRWSAANLEAWKESYRRFQGAQAAGSEAGMLRQARAMLSFARRGLALTESASSDWYRFEKSVYESLKDAGLISENPDWKETWTQGRTQLQKAGLPADVTDTLLSSGFSQQQIADLRAGALELSSQQIREVLTDWRIEYELLSKEGDNAERAPPLIDPLLWLDLERQAAELVWQLEAGDESPGKEAIRLRPGLLEALQRRAGFTRTQQGPMAALRTGDMQDSDPHPASWHAGDRTYFAWHRGEQIVFAGFSAAGEVLFPPQVIGDGRWPTIAGDGNQLAIAWQTGNGSAVRIFENQAWGKSIPLSGHQASLAFAPDRRLFAASTTGLWRLGGTQFEAIMNSPLENPAIGFDSDGKPVVVSQHQGRIIQNGRDVASGQDPSLARGPDQRLYLAFRSGRTLQVSVRSGRSWRPHYEIKGVNPVRPTLATGAAGLRLSYVDEADPGPEGVRLVELPSDHPILVPTLAGNVKEAALFVNFNLQGNFSKFRPHDLLITVNDVWINLFQDAIPQGRFRFPLHPMQVFTSSGAPVSNRVGLYSWHGNAGAYKTTSGYTLLVRTDWSEFYGYGSGEEIVQATEGLNVNHDRSDLALIANGLDIPIERPDPGRIPFEVTIINLGEGRSGPSLLKMKGAGVSAGARIPALDPGEQKVVTMLLDYDGYISRLSFRLEQSSPDYDPENDLLTLTLWDPPRDTKGLTGVVVLIGSGRNSYQLYDESGTRVVSQRTNQGVEVPPGSYQLELNGVRIPVEAQHGQKTVVGETGRVRVMGRGAFYSVLDSSGTKLATTQTSRSAYVELLPGDYQVELNRIRLPASIEAGQETVAGVTGSVQVIGRGAFYSVLNSSGTKLASTQTSSTGRLELFPGDYVVEFRGTRIPVRVEPEKNTVAAQTGSLVVTGSGGFYQIDDSTGRLVAKPQTNSAFELLPGTYSVKKDGREFSAEIRSGQKTTISP